MHNYTLADMHLSRVVAGGLVLPVCGERIGSPDEERKWDLRYEKRGCVLPTRGHSEVFSWSKIVGSKITGQLYIYVIIEEGVKIECIKGRSWKLVEYSVSGTIYHHL